MLPRPPERLLPAGSTWSAAEAVCGAEPLAPEDVIDLLSSLVEKSLVMLEQGDGRVALRAAGNHTGIRARAFRP